VAFWNTFLRRLEIAMSVQSDIEIRLKEAFQPERLAVINESHLHAGHRPADEGDETHMRVRIVTPAFSGLSRIQRHRVINEALKPAFDAGLHALAIEAAAPGEPVRW
jgi:BolA family transcriptional regulator, general stress-responsive regulator